MHDVMFASAAPMRGLFLAQSVLHPLIALAGFIGVAFLLMWAYKSLTPATLRLWGFILAITAAVLCAAITAGFGRGHMRVQMMRGGDAMTWEGKAAAPGMMMNDADANMMPANGMMMNHSMGAGGMMGMSMDDMAMMLKGKTGDDFDKAFLEGMIPHHQGAIDMAKMAAASAKHDEIKAMATAIMEAQQKEIAQMQAWQKSWGYVK